MAAVPRIVVVDPSDEVAGIVRGAMSLLDRPYILVEVPTADDALAELSNSQVDLLITAFTLAGQTGLEVASRAIRESASTFIIVLADADDPEVDSKTLENAPYTYLVRPVGEPFLRVLRIGLDGEAAVSVQETAATPGSSSMDIGPIPQLNMEVITRDLTQIMIDTGASGIMVADRMGRVAMSEGSANYYDFNKEVVAALLAPSVARTADLRDVTGGHAWTLQYYNGDNLDIYLFALGVHYYMILIFDAAKRSAATFGSVISYGRRKAENIIDELGDDAWTFRRTTSLITQSMPVVETRETEVDVLDATEPEPEAPQRPPELQLDPVEDIDAELLFSQDVNEDDFDALFGDDDVNESSFMSGNDIVSFDDAMDMGILDQ
jgi:DNA-binding NarL/FixJ family response regulator